MVSSFVELSFEDARQLYAVADSVHDFDHILRVFALAERIATVEKADLRVVRLATLLHDWGRAEAAAEKLDHAQVAADHVREFLSARNVPEEWIAAVEHAVRAHRFRTAPEPQTLEAKVLFDADKLDAIGAIGIARAFAYGGALNQRLCAPLDVARGAAYDQAGAVAKEHTAVHEFVMKLSRIKDRLYTDEGRAIAAERHQYMEEFYVRLDAETRGEL